MSKYILSTQSLSEFFERVLNTERHFFSAESQEFLEALLASSHSRVRMVEKGQEYYHARINYSKNDFLTKEELKPIKDLCSEGRINSYNLNVLYLSNRKETAIAETRVEKQKDVTVARFITNKKLKLIDCTQDRPDWDWYFNSFNPQTKEQAEKYTWIELGGAFSRPAEEEKLRHYYIPTQIIAEFFKNQGFDGIVYQSQFDARVEKENKHEGISENIALFNINDADPQDAEIWKIQRKIIEVSRGSNKTITYSES